MRASMLCGGLLGREREVAELGARVQDAVTRLTTLVGPGGVGKDLRGGIDASSVWSRCGPRGARFSQGDGARARRRVPRIRGTGRRRPTAGRQPAGTLAGQACAGRARQLRAPARGKCRGCGAADALSSRARSSNQPRAAAAAARGGRAGLRLSGTSASP
jgi:hypothetical protein